MDFVNPLETKVASAAAQDDVLIAFEAFKDANDERLAQIEKRMAADVVTQDKVERISRAIDELSLKAKRPHLSGETCAEPSEHKKAFDGYVRKGETQGLFDIEAKSMSIASNPDGGYLVPSETEAEIGRILAKVSPMRQIADVRQVSSAVYKKPFAVTGSAYSYTSTRLVVPPLATAPSDFSRIVVSPPALLPGDGLLSIEPSLRSV